MSVNIEKINDLKDNFDNIFLDAKAEIYHEYKKSDTSLESFKKEVINQIEIAKILAWALIKEYIKEEK